jgi:hypothetical protein
MEPVPGRTRMVRIPYADDGATGAQLIRKPGDGTDHRRWASLIRQVTIPSRISSYRSPRPAKPARIVGISVGWARMSVGSTKISVGS